MSVSYYSIYLFISVLFVNVSCLVILVKSLMLLLSLFRLSSVLCPELPPVWLLLLLSRFLLSFLNKFLQSLQYLAMTC